MDRPNDEFELFLREFEARRPRALIVPGASRSLWMSRLAAAAAISIALGSSLRFFSRPTEWRKSRDDTNTTSAKIAPRASTPKLSTMALTRLALEDPARLDALLDASQQDRLPRFDRENSALRVLAKE
jgi:hypothetical protein